MTEQNQDGTQRIFISEVQRHQARYRKLIQFTHSSTKAAGAMLLAAVVALIVANTGAYEAFLEFWHTEAGFFFGDAFAGMSLAHVINDIFMAVFFLLVGLEVKYELTVGELTNIRQALLPIMAAIGGVIAPGVDTSAAALFSRATRLAAIDLVDPHTAIGGSTEQAIQAGIVYGEADRVDGLVRRIFAQLGYEAPVVATGGLAPRVAELSQTITATNPELTLEGLRLIHEAQGGGVA